MGQRRSVLDREDPLPGDLDPVLLDRERRGCANNARQRVRLADRGEHRLDTCLRRRVDLVDDADVGHAQVRLARVVAQLVTGAVRIEDDDVQGRLDERRVVVAAVPEDHVGLLLGGVEDRRVVDAGEDEVALVQVRLVLLALLDRTIGSVEVGVAREPLDRLLFEIAVGHRVAEDGNALARAAQELGDVARRLALPGARAHGADGHDRLRRGQHRLARRQQPVRGTGGERARAEVHDVLVRDVRV